MHTSITRTVLPLLLPAAVLSLGPGDVAALAAGASTPPCSTSDLKASYRHHDDAAGHSYGSIVLRNTSGHACHTGGYPGVSYVGRGNGTQIGAPAVRTNRSAVTTLVVAAGARVRSPLDEVRAQNFPRRRCRPANVDGFRVYVPNATKSQFVQHVTTGCRNHHVKLMYLKPLRRP
jgi:hypothetical protein